MLALFKFIEIVWDLVVLAVIVYGAYDISTDVKAFWNTRKINKYARINMTGTIDIVVAELLDHAPDSSTQPYSWVGYDDNPPWFAHYGDIRGMYLKESGDTLTCKIERATTLVDFVTFNFDPATKVVGSIDFKVCWHGRPIPVYSKTINLKPDERWYGSLYGKGYDADIVAIWKLRNFYNGFKSMST